MSDPERLRARGVCWSGLGPDPVRPDAILRRACALRDALAAWEASPAGRLHATLARARAAARDAHTAATALEAALARGDATADETAQTLSRSAAVLSACATNIASSRPSTTSPGNSAS